MQEIILNEKKLAEEILSEKHFINKPSQDIHILAKYFTSLGKSEEDIYTMLCNIVCEYLQLENACRWEKFIQYQIKYAQKYKLVEIDNIPVTKKEIKVIQSLDGKRLEKLAFTLLVIAKYYNTINDKNNNWTNKDFKAIFSLANISVTKAKQCMLINELKERNLIELSKKINNLNMKLLYVDKSQKQEDIAVFIDNMVNIGNQYIMKVKNDGSLKRCANCNTIIRINKNRKYCTKCSEEIKKAMQREWIKEKRKKAKEHKED